MRRKSAIAFALFVVLVVAGLYLYSYKREWVIDTVGGPEARTQLIPRPCGFATQSGRDLACYDLLVPENRVRAGSRLLRLPILVFAAPERPKFADPVLLIGGGPGAIAYTEKLYASMWKDKFKDWAWLKGRDLIVYDQRGVGGARPALECPEVDATREEPLNIERAKAAMVACRDRLVREGIDLLAYDTNANADDILSIKAKLGIASLNLWGQSYGTRIALTLMRRDPPGIRAAILDGAYPPEIAGKFNMAWTFVVTMDRVFEACEKDEDCRTDYPDFRQRFVQVVEQLRARPIAVKSDPSPLLSAKVFQVNDVIFLSIVDSLLYTADGVGKLPWIVDRLAAGKPEALTDAITEWDQVAYGPFVTTGASYLVDCNDTNDPDDADERRLAARHTYLRSWIDYSLSFKPCPVWSARKAPALERTPVKSTIPTVIISGFFDIATPPEWAAIGARALPKSQLVRVMGASHDASEHACAQSALAAFIVKPDSDLGLFCGPTPANPRFKRKSDEE